MSVTPRARLTAILQTRNDHAATCTRGEQETCLGHGEDGESRSAFQDVARDDLVQAIVLDVDKGFDCG